jgi:methyltransferase
MTPLVALSVAAALMLVELRVSIRNERVLRQHGAVAPPDPAYATMRWAYPGVFVLMAVERLFLGPPDGTFIMAGTVIFAAAKMLKAWAILTLGDRWTYRLFVLPGTPLVSHGPYHWMRHPNYLAVIAELIGFALIVGARATGILAVLFFGELLRRRIRAEEAALGLNG